MIALEKQFGCQNENQNSKIAIDKKNEKFKTNPSMTVTGPSEPNIYTWKSVKDQFLRLTALKATNLIFMVGPICGSRLYRIQAFHNHPMQN